METRAGCARSLSRRTSRRAESPEDYDEKGRVKLPNEYSDWFASAENVVRNQAVLAGAESELRITSPLAGSTYLLDPDIPSSRRIPVAVVGAEKPLWRSDSLRFASSEGGEFALAEEGEHRIAVIDAETGRSVEVLITIRSL